MIAIFVIAAAVITWFGLEEAMKFPGKDVKKVFVTNNFADGGVKIINNAADRLTATDNE